MKDAIIPNRCVIITNGNLFSMLALGAWIREHGQAIAKVYVTTRLPSEKNNLVGVLRLLRNSGWDYTHFKVWVNVLAPRILRRNGLPASVAELLRSYGYDTPVERVASANASEVVDEITGLKPEWLISFSATHRFHAPLINTPSRGAVNIHWGLLPAYAGLSPYFWHLCFGETIFGVTLHRIDRQLDTGPIIEQVTGEMDDAASALEVALLMADRVSPLLCRLFELGSLPDQLQEQDLSRRSYFRHPTRAQMRDFHRRGLRMKDHRGECSLTDRVRDLARVGTACLDPSTTE